MINRYLKFQSSDVSQYPFSPSHPYLIRNRRFWFQRRHPVFNICSLQRGNLKTPRSIFPTIANEPRKHDKQKHAYHNIGRNVVIPLVRKIIPEIAVDGKHFKALENNYRLIQTWEERNLSGLSTLSRSTRGRAGMARLPRRG
jgi:hypothetical protein